MAFVYKQPVYAQLLKGNYIVLAVCASEFIQPCLQGLSCFLHLLDGKVFATAVFQLCNRFFDFINLLLQLAFLPFSGQRYFFKLRMPDNNGIIIASGNSSTKLLTPCGFKILFGGY